MKRNRVYKGINQPLLVLGVERRLFFVSVILAVAFFNGFNSPLGALMIFASGYVFGLWATKTDPEILRIVLNSEKFKAHYSGAKFTPVKVHKERYQ